MNNTIRYCYTKKHTVCPSRARRQLSSDAEASIIDHLLHAQKRGFAVDKPALFRVTGAVARKERRLLPNNEQLDEWLRSFRARRREITYLSHVKRTWQKLGPRITNALRIQKMDCNLCQKHRILKEGPILVWNLDEADVSPEFGMKRKV